MAKRSESEHRRIVGSLRARPWLQLFIVLGLLACGVGVVVATSTKRFEIDDAEGFSEGELRGTMVRSNGALVVGGAASRLALSEAKLAYSLLRGPDGTFYVGAAPDGKVFRVQQGKASLYAQTQSLLVTSMAWHPEGEIIAGSLPKGVLYRIDKKGKARVFSTLPETNHIWDIVYSKSRKVFLVATGPKGKVWAVDLRGRANLFYDTRANHALCLALEHDEQVLVGTSDEAILYRVRGPGRGEVVYDFPGTEVTDVEVKGKLIAAAVTDFDKPRSGGGGPAPKVDAKRPDFSAAAFPGGEGKAGKGQVWFLDGPRIELALENGKAYFSRVLFADAHSVYAAAGADGRVYWVNRERESAIWVDVDERQVLALALEGDQPVFTTGDGAAFYKLGSGKARKALWTSKVLDARFPSRFGNLSWRGKGTLRLQTRSGNTVQPDASWSSWSAAMRAQGRISSPSARYLQVRADLSEDPLATLYALTAFYLPQNQRCSLKSLKLKRRERRSSTEEGGSDVSESSTPEASALYSLSWEGESYDKDPLRYRLYFRAESQKEWRPMLRDETPYTKTEYAWNTAAIPDGYYRVRVHATDELSNPGEQKLSCQLESEPILVDNHAPKVQKLAYRGGRLSGEAKDDTSPIAKLEYAIDGREWHLFEPKDGLFDASSEPFDLALSFKEEGEHIVAVRATDAAGNMAAAELVLQTRAKRASRR